MLRVLSVLGAAGLLALTPADVLAGPKGAKKGKGQGQGLEALFKKLDTNHDGKLSKDEFAKITELRKGKGEGAAVKVKEKAVDTLFGKLDANNDGALTLDEFKKIIELRQKKADK
jgi:Ca2+-binding EF-hand superfamily protein